jgi:hypothetical protein
MLPAQASEFNIVRGEKDRSPSRWKLVSSTREIIGGNVTRAWDMTRLEGLRRTSIEKDEAVGAPGIHRQGIQ